MTNQVDFARKPLCVRKLVGRDDKGEGRLTREETQVVLRRILEKTIAGLNELLSRAADCVWGGRQIRVIRREALRLVREAGFEISSKLGPLSKIPLSRTVCNVIRDLDSLISGSFNNIFECVGLSTIKPPRPVSVLVERAR